MPHAWRESLGGTKGDGKVAAMRYCYSMAFLSGLRSAKKARPAAKARLNISRKKFSLGIFPQKVPRYPDR